VHGTRQSSAPNNPSFRRNVVTPAKAGAGIQVIPSPLDSGVRRRDGIGNLLTSPCVGGTILRMSEPPHRKIKRALISVYDKTGIVEFARALVDEFGIEIISTGGTASLLKENGIPVTLVEEITGFPEMLDGRVKTLHPKIHAGILADRDNPEHMRQLEEQGIKPIDMVVVNLYPFEETVSDPICTFEQAIEMIDIGGPCMLRAAAKNHKHVLLVVAHDHYEYDLTESYLREWSGSIESHVGSSRARAWEGFLSTSKYDAQVICWLNPLIYSRSPELRALYMRGAKLRYGENPHQRAQGHTWLEDRDLSNEPDITRALNVNNHDWSYNNLADAHAALGLCAELSRALSSHEQQREPSDEGRAKILFAQPGARPESAELPSSDGSEEDEKSQRFPSITREVTSRRNLPHWQIPGATYFITFRSAVGVLSPEERDITMSAIRHWDGVRLDLHAAVVMPDHLHLLLSPRDDPDSGGGQFNLSALLQSIKAYSGREISKIRGGNVTVWVHESFDRWIRSDSDFVEKYAYMANNPVKEGLADMPEDYRWWYGVEAMPDDSRFATGECAKVNEENLNSPHAANKENLCSPQPVSKEDLCSPHCCTFIKHTNACGVGIADDPVEAYRRAYLGDPNAAMGGILACNFDVDRSFAECVMDTYSRWGKEAGAGGFFVEVWVAPSFKDDAVEHIRSAKAWGQRVRLLAMGDMNVPPNPDELEYRSISGGMLIQTRDTVGLNEDQWKVVTKRMPTESEMSDLRLAWLIAKHTKSNAISVCKDGMLIGNGAGQMSRVMSCRIATWLANENGHKDKLAGSVAASDAFFPFADGPNILIDAGVGAIIQPGGSKRDEEVTAACDARDVAMIFTGTRHFKH